MPITYLGRDGKQYLAVMSSGSGGRNPEPPRLYVFSLP